MGKYVEDSIRKWTADNEPPSKEAIRSTGKIHSISRKSFIQGIIFSNVVQFHPIAAQLLAALRRHMEPAKPKNPDLRRPADLKGIITKVRSVCPSVSNDGRVRSGGRHIH